MQGDIQGLCLSKKREFFEVRVQDINAGVPTMQPGLSIGNVGMAVDQMLQQDNVPVAISNTGAPQVYLEEILSWTLILKSIWGDHDVKKLDSHFSVDRILKTR